jgi:hypothetical protein
MFTPLVVSPSLIFARACASGVVREENGHFIILILSDRPNDQTNDGCLDISLEVIGHTSQHASRTHHPRAREGPPHTRNEPNRTDDASATISPIECGGRRRGDVARKGWCSGFEGGIGRRDGHAFDNPRALARTVAVAIATTVVDSKSAFDYGF